MHHIPLQTILDSGELQRVTGYVSPAVPGPLPIAVSGCVSRLQGLCRCRWLGECDNP